MILFVSTKNGIQTSSLKKKKEEETSSFRLYYNGHSKVTLGRIVTLNLNSPSGKRIFFFQRNL